MKKLEFSGRVFSSKGEGKKFLTLPWVTHQITQKLGFTPYPGTLNLRLSEGSVQRKELLEKACSITIVPAEGYCNGKLFKAFIGKLECAIVIPEVPGYPRDVLEIIAPVNLREMLKLNDGDEVAVTVLV
ncbi:MAG: DUF120 domain-containing protein [Candidatus Bathyarchaeales archaeon]